jgi:hypothetical protein
MNDVTFKGLTEKQTAFVNAYVYNGGKVGAAAKKAGFVQVNEGSRLLREPKIVKAIQSLMQDALSIHAVKALATVAKLSLRSRSEYVRLQASIDLLDRAGYKAPDRSLVKVSGDLSVSFDISPRSENDTVYKDITPRSENDTQSRSENDTDDKAKV